MTPLEDAEAKLDAFLRRLAERTGLDVDGSHRPRMAQTVTQMCRDARAASYDLFAAQLERDPERYEALIDRLRIGETYFFREPAHFDLLRELIVPAWLRGPGDRTLQVWSAGCASGEEPYSVAIALAGMGLLDRARILGTDLSEGALHAARASTYGAWSLRRVDDEQRRTWFLAQGRRFRLRERYKGAHEWRLHSLVDGPPGGSFDIVLCRNVLIYLTPEALRSATASLHDALAPDGWLLLGASDPVLDHPGLERRVGDHGVAYQRTCAFPAEALIATGPVQAVRDRRRAVRSGDTSSQATSSQEKTRRTRVPGPPRLAVSPKLPVGDRRVPALPVPVEPAVAGEVAAAIRALADRGALDDALEMAGAAIASDPADAELRCLAATVHLGAGRPADAVSAATAAVYLDPWLVAAHLLLAQAEQQTGNAERARRSYRNALELLLAMPAEAEVPLTDGEVAAHLADVVAERLHTERQPARR